jgi:hypothetical protein
LKPLRLGSSLLTFPSGTVAHGPAVGDDHTAQGGEDLGDFLKKSDPKFNYKDLFGAEPDTPKVPARTAALFGGESSTPEHHVINYQHGVSQAPLTAHQEATLAASVKDAVGDLGLDKSSTADLMKSVQYDTRKEYADTHQHASPLSGGGFGAGAVLGGAAVLAFVLFAACANRQTKKQSVGNVRKFRSVQETAAGDDEAEELVVVKEEGAGEDA